MILFGFLSCDLEDSMPVFDKFLSLDGAIPVLGGGKNNFVYVPGTRKDRVLLVAHADTVWDKYYSSDPWKAYFEEKNMMHRIHRISIDGNIIRQGGSDVWGIGADDRAGCAMLWLLRKSGHSLLVTDGEEHGQIGAHFLMSNYPDIAEEINEHNYMIQLDRRNGNDYKTYSLPVTDEFRDYIESQTSFVDAGRTSRTDIVVLCRKICGVNFSVGYCNEHTGDEYLNIDHWLNTYNTVKSLLEKEQPRFPLKTFE